MHTGKHAGHAANTRQTRRYLLLAALQRGDTTSPMVSPAASCLPRCLCPSAPGPRRLATTPPLRLGCRLRPAATQLCAGPAYKSAHPDTPACLPHLRPSPHRACRRPPPPPLSAHPSPPATGWLNDLYSFSPVDKVVTALSPFGSPLAPSPRYAMGFAATPDGMLYVFGGNSRSGNVRGGGGSGGGWCRLRGTPSCGVHVPHRCCLSLYCGGDEGGAGGDV
jgi:hypothetical protein